MTYRFSSAKAACGAGNPFQMYHPAKFKSSETFRQE